MRTVARGYLRVALLRSLLNSSSEEMPSYDARRTATRCLLGMTLLLRTARSGQELSTLRADSSHTRLGWPEFWLSEGSLDRRPIYFNGELYLYHVHDPREGWGRWQVGETAAYGSVSGVVAYIESWAVSPLDIAVASPLARWSVRERKEEGADYSLDATFGFTCARPPSESGCLGSTLALSSPLHPALSGVYVETLDGGRPLWLGPRLFLYGDVKPHFSGFVDGRWQLGEEPGAEDCLAYGAEGGGIHVSMRGGGWRHDRGARWYISFSAARGEAHVGGALAQLREDGLSPPAAQSPAAAALERPVADGGTVPRHGISLGSLPAETAEEAVVRGLEMGYRLIDTADEWGNERAMGTLFAGWAEEAMSSAEARDARARLFVLAKLWPTRLGFADAREAAEVSRRRLGTPFVDMQMLSWPGCPLYFLDCSAISPGATWQQSWRALERAYSEGLVMHLGVANFDLEASKRAPRTRERLRRVIAAWGLTTAVSASYWAFICPPTPSTAAAAAAAVFAAVVAVVRCSSSRMRRP